MLTNDVVIFSISSMIDREESSELIVDNFESVVISTAKSFRTLSQMRGSFVGKEQLVSI
jgi:hypothetical protein